MGKRIISFMLALVLVLGTMPVNALATSTVVDSGTCGENLTWVLTDEGTLTISGSGAMADYGDSSSNTPWYDNRSDIVSVVISDGVTSVGDCAFNDCSNLTSVEIPDSVCGIGSGAFANCSSLINIMIPISVTSIGEQVFCECASLTEICVDDNNTYFSNDNSGVLFDKNKTILISAPGAISGEYLVPDSVTCISEYAFYNCDNLTGVNIADGVTSIPDYAFYSCDSLTGVTIPTGVTEIGWWSFAYSGVTCVTIPENVDFIDRSAFARCYNLSKILFEGDAPYFRSVDYDWNAGEFLDVIATAYYPKNNLTWSTVGSMQDYGGLITWIPYVPGEPLPEPETTKPIPKPLKTPIEVEEQGDGTAAHPYKITSEDDFALISLDSDAHYILAADFTVSENQEIEFSGVFDGNHHTLTLTNDAAVGLFRINRGTIKNLNINVSTHLNVDNTNLSFDNGDAAGVGCICSLNEGTIQDCTVKGNLSVTFPQYGTGFFMLGSIAGYNYGDIERCWSALDMSTNSKVNQLFIGGIAGENTGCVSECLNTGKIDATIDCANLSLIQNSLVFRLYIGGIVGFPDGNSEIDSCIQAGESLNACMIVLLDSYNCVLIPHSLKYGFIAGGEFEYGSAAPQGGTVTNCMLHETSVLNRDYHDTKMVVYDKLQYLPAYTEHETLRYNEIQQWWDNLDRPSGTENGDEHRNGATVRYFYSWDAENQIAYFDTDPTVDALNFGSQVTEETDTSFLENVEDLVGTYVLVETKVRDDGMLLPDTLISINQVGTVIGTIQSFDADTVTIDNVVWPLGENAGLLFMDMDVEIVYHIYEGSVVGVDSIQTTTGLLSGWDTASGELAIHSANNKLFTLSRSVEAELTELLNNSNLLDPITVTHDNLGIVYRAVITKQEQTPEYELFVYSKHQQLSLETEHTIEIVCSLYYADELVTKWEKPILTVSDSSVIDVVACEKLESGYCITVEAISPGTATLLITDGNSGAKTMQSITVFRDEQILYSYIIDDVPSFYPDVFGDRKTQTNVYNCNGLYVNNFPTELTKVDGKYVLEFDVYNSLYMYGAVDIFDAAGNWIESYQIDKYTSVHGLWDTVVGAVFLIRDTVTKNALSYTAASYSKKTHVEISVPEGGYFTISANYAKSPGAFLYNAIDFMMVAAQEGVDLVLDDDGLKEIQDATLKKILSTPEFIDTFYETFSEIALLAGAEAVTGGYGELAGALTVHAGELFEHLKIDFWGIVSLCTGVGEEVLLTLTPAGMGKLLAAMYKFSELCDLTGQTVQITQSVKKGYIAMYTPEATTDLTISGVTVTPEAGTLPDRSVVQVFRVANHDALIITDTGLADVYEEYNISFVADGSEVQPDGKVTVKIPVPDEYVDDECIVLHQQEDGSWQIVEGAEIVDGFIVFTVDHFSCFAVAPALKQTGTCGSNAYWKLTENGKLHIIGSGAINDYSESSVAPWGGISSGIQTVKIEKGITSIGDYSFYNCSALESIVIPEGITTIGKYAFSGCSQLMDLQIPNTVTSIGYDGFSNCTALKKITLPEGINSISASMFEGCTALTTVVIPDNVTKIGGYAFNECTSLEKIEIPQNVSTIYSCAFSNCTSLKDIVLPEKITELIGYVFAGCTSLTRIDIPDSVSYIGYYAFSDCTSLSEVKMPEKLTEIESYAFKNCTSLRNIDLPEAVSIIRSYAFYRCKALTEIAFPASVTSLGSRMFWFCNSLENIVFEGSVPNMANDVFDAVTATAYYPAGNETWTEDVRQQYGGTITWVPVCSEHNYDLFIVEPTCTEKGYTTHTCTICGDSYVDTYVNPLGHDMGEWKITKEATSVKEGTKVRSCKRDGCEYQETETIPALGIAIPAKPYKIVNVVSGVHVYWNTTEGAAKYGLWRSETGKDGTYKWLANPTVPHFTDTKVESGKTYYYKVTAMDSTGTHSGKSAAIGIAFVSTPDITSRSNTAAGVKLGWEKITGATGYAIYRKSYSGTDAWVRIGTISGNATFTWTDTSVKNNNGEIYKYTIRALAGSDMKTLSGCRNAGRTMVRLSSQVLKSAAKASTTSVKCTWTTSSRVTGYEVRFTAADGTVKTFTVGNYKTGTKTFTGLKASQNYTVQVRTYKKVDGVGSFYSDWSTAKTVSTK